MTLKDIAEKAGVSMMTVSNVINKKNKPGIPPDRCPHKCYHQRIRLRPKPQRPQSYKPQD